MSTINLLTADSPLDAMNPHCIIPANLISYWYGEETLRELTRLEKLQIDKCKNIAHLSFLKQCRDKNIIPTFARITHSLKNNHNNMLFKKMGFMLVRDQIRNIRFSLEKLDRQLLILHTQLENALDKVTWDYWDRCSSRRADMIYKKLKIKQNSKLLKLEQDRSHEVNAHDL